MDSSALEISDDINIAAGNYPTNSSVEGEATAEETPIAPPKKSPSSPRLGTKAARRPQELIDEFLFNCKGKLPDRSPKRRSPKRRAGNQVKL